MEGMILAAGLGTRLRPLTDRRPKALVEVGGVPLLRIAIERMATAGIRHAVVNVHHMADMVEDYLRSTIWPIAISVSDERNQLLDTGGALAHVAHLFSGKERVLIHNVDVLSRIDFAALEHHHQQMQHMATLCVSLRPSQRLLCFSEDGLLTGRAPKGALPDGHTMAFSGIALVEPALLSLLPEANRPYSIIDEYIRLSQDGHRIGLFHHRAEDWLDVGRPETLTLAQQWKASSTK